MNFFIFYFFLTCSWSYAFLPKIQAEFALGAGKTEAAQSALTAALINDPHSASTLYNLGQLSYQQGDYSLAQHYFQSAAQEKNISSQLKLQANYQLGNALVKQKKWKDALESFKEVIQQEPEHKEAHDMIKQLETLLRQQEQQKNQSSQESPENPDASSSPPEQNDNNQQSENEQKENSPDASCKNNESNKSKNKDDENESPSKRDSSEDNNASSQDQSQSMQEKLDQEQRKSDSPKKPSADSSPESKQTKQPGEPTRKRGQRSKQRSASGKQSNAASSQSDKEEPQQDRQTLLLTHAEERDAATAKILLQHEIKASAGGTYGSKNW